MANVSALDSAVIAVQCADGTIVGTGFVVAHRLAVTCAHVIERAGSKPGRTVYVTFYEGGSCWATVLEFGYCSSDADDVAFLELADQPKGVLPVVLGRAAGCEGDKYSSLGYARLAGYEVRKPTGDVQGVIQALGKRPMLELVGDRIKEGLSGAPLLDLGNGRVIGMVSEFKDDHGTRQVWATTADTICQLQPTLRLWPGTYGPVEMNAYLDLVIDRSSRLSLPDGKEVPLERLYVSLRADAMNATEWQAEQDQLFDVESLQVIEEGMPTSVDAYERRRALNRAIQYHPRPLMHTARDWEVSIGQRDRTMRSLAEVVRQHPHVVLLGDPGSGKTSLGRWLALQFALAMRQGRARVIVREDDVRAGQDSDTTIDLGEPRLPMFLRAAEYAIERWGPNGDTHLKLEQFLGLQYPKKSLPEGLSTGAIGDLCRDHLATGRVLIILDGIDEIADIDRRRLVMQEASRFVADVLHQPAEMRDAAGTEEARTWVMMTSRPVGYHVEPVKALAHFTIEEMDDKAIAAYCAAWLRHVAELPDDELEPETEQLRAAIFDHAHRGVLAMARNPLLLSLLAQVYWGGARGTLPPRRVELFTDSLEAIYKQRRSLWDQNRITLPKLKRGLGAVAMRVHAGPGGGYAEEGTVRDALMEAFQDEEQVEAVLEAAREVSGFLVARGEGMYGFIHRALQEFLAAVHITRDPAKLAAELRGYVLDPSWREPVALVGGIVSGASYPGSMSRLAEVFDVLLTVPDPAAEFLPLRELAAVAVSVECARVPSDIGRRIAVPLLALYVQREGRGRSSVLRKRIQHAFADLLRSPARGSVDAVLCDGIRDMEFERRYASIDIIIETKWDSETVAAALMDSWCTHADPAGSMLVAIDGVWDRQPAMLSSRLTFRKAMKDNPQLWDRMTSHDGLRQMVLALYRPLGLDAWPDQASFESVLTQRLLSCLAAPDLGPAFDEMCVELHQLAAAPGTAIARDAVVALSAAGDTTWVEAFVAGCAGNERAIRPVGIRLERVLALACACARTLASDLASARDLALALAGDLNRVLTHDRSRGQNRALTRARDRSLARARDRALNLARVLDLERHGDSIHDLNSDRARAYDLDSDRARAQDLDFEPARARGFDLDLARSRALARDLARGRALARDLDLDFARDLASAISEQLDETMKVAWSQLPQLAELLDSAAGHVRSLLSMSGLNNIEYANSRLMIHWHMQYPTTRASMQTHEGPAVLTRKSLPQIISDLVSGDDGRRSRARLVLRDLGAASDLGRKVIEELAQSVVTNSGDHRVSTPLDWALKSIKHDTASWVQSWVEAIDEPYDSASCEAIVSNIHHASPKTVKVMIDALNTAPPVMQKALLHALTWLARAGDLPIGTRDVWRNQLLEQLSDASEPAVMHALVTTLAYWPDSSMRTGEQLLALLETEACATVHKAIYFALGRMFGRNETIAHRIEARLRCDAALEPEAAAAMARIFVAPSAATPKLASDVKTSLTEVISSPVNCFSALLDAGVNDDVWNDNDHGLLIAAATQLLEQHADAILPTLVGRMRSAMVQAEWPQRRITIAAAAACAERMPTALWKASGHNLEHLLLAATEDYDSFNVRRFGLTSLSYLRRMTPTVARALLAGCGDVAMCQKDAITAAGRFNAIDGDPLPIIQSALTGPSASTAYGAALVLGALGASPAAATEGFRNRIIEVLVGALADPSAQREVELEDLAGGAENSGRLEDALHDALLRVVGL